MNPAKLAALLKGASGLTAGLLLCIVALAVSAVLVVLLLTLSGVALVALLVVAGPLWLLYRLRPKPVADLGVLLAMPTIADEERNTRPGGGRP